MAQSLNKTVLLNTTGTSYLSIAGKVGKFLVGDQALEFYPDVNVEQIYPDSLEPYQPDWSQCHWSQNQSPLRSLYRSRKIFSLLKRLRCHSENCSRKNWVNDKVVKLPTLIQTIGQKFKKSICKKVETLV